MYVPEHFRETRVEVLQAFVDRHPLATLVAVTAEGLTANHIPLVSQLGPDGGGVLRGHIARANSLWRELAPGAPVMAVFTGADSYVTPRWYPSTAEHGKVVPTWNYSAVHVSGTIRFIEDRAWLRDFVGSLTDIHEAGQPDPWRVEDAPADYIEGMLRAIVGLEILVTGTSAKFKGSQNRSGADRAGVAAGLLAVGRTAQEADQLAPQ